MQKETVELLDTLLAEPTLSAATGTGSERDGRNAFTAMRPGQLRMLLNDHGVKYPTDDSESVRLCASYIVEREYYKRKGQQDRVERLTGKLHAMMARRNIKFLTAKDEDTAMALATVEETKVRKGTKKGTKKATKPATKKAAKKKAAKPAAEGEVGAPRYANDLRKIKVLAKENPHREGTGRAEAFEAMKKSKTVADYAATGNKPKYINQWVDDGHISLS